MCAYVFICLYACMHVYGCVWMCVCVVHYNSDALTSQRLETKLPPL